MDDCQAGLVLFASSAARPKDVEADLAQLKLERPLKTLQGQVLFSPAASLETEDLARSLLKLSTLDYVHILLASCPVVAKEPRQASNSEDTSSNSALSNIRAAAAGVGRSEFERAIALWRVVAQLEGRDASAVATPTDQLVFRSIGKRGGRGHDFTSDEAKRAAKEGLTAATGLGGSSSKELAHLDVLAQVHCNRFWLGLRLNRTPLAPQPTAGNGTSATSDGGNRAATMAVVVTTTDNASCGVATPPPEKAASEAASEAAPKVASERTAASIAPAPRGTARGRDATATAERGAERSAESGAEPPLLSGWLAARLRELGLDRPRDARDAVSPLWEVPLPEQLRRKEAEMRALVAKLLADAEERHAGRGGGSKGGGDEGGKDAAAADTVCAPIRSAVADGAAVCALRNTCEFHIGRDREGHACVGFRLGVGSSRDGVAVGSADGVPFVPPWMAACAAAATAVLREYEDDATQSAARRAAAVTAAGQTGGESGKGDKGGEGGEEGGGGGSAVDVGDGDGKSGGGGAKDSSRQAACTKLPYSLLRLRGSLRTGESMALLTATSGAGAAGAEGGVVGACADKSDAELGRRLVAAAATHGQRLRWVLVRNAAEAGEGMESSAGALAWRSLLPPLDPPPPPSEASEPPDAADPDARPGVISERLASGLRLRVAPLAFFQASTDAAEVLFRTVVEMALGTSPPGGGGGDGGPSSATLPSLSPPPQLVLDLCCGGGALGLEVAAAAAASATAASAAAAAAAAAAGTADDVGAFPTAAPTRVVGIELNASAVDDAKRNAAANGLHAPQYEAICARAEHGLDDVLAGCARAGEARAVAIVDPPRTGLAPSVCKALRNAPAVDRVVYVSCNPHGHTLRHDYVVKGGSLAANLRVLTAARGRGAPFQLVRAVPVDMFAHTPHVELCLLLERVRAR